MNSQNMRALRAVPAICAIASGIFLAGCAGYSNPFSAVANIGSDFSTPPSHTLKEPTINAMYYGVKGNLAGSPGSVVQELFKDVGVTKHDAGLLGFGKSVYTFNDQCHIRILSDSNDKVNGVDVPIVIHENGVSYNAGNHYRTTLECIRQDYSIGDCSREIALLQELAVNGGKEVNTPEKVREYREKAELAKKQAEDEARQNAKPKSSKARKSRKH
ncbi:MAG: hypothetical protein PUI29_11355 [Aeromonadales bacterium]|nr:hypothetical protein [Aeromonadales bacterium]MDY2891610.1 hypothetical protein [Succinivibrio sp.]